MLLSYILVFQVCPEKTTREALENSGNRQDSLHFRTVIRERGWEGERERGREGGREGQREREREGGREGVREGESEGESEGEREGFGGRKSVRWGLV